MIDVRMWSIIDDRRKLLAQVGSMIGDRRSEKTSEKKTLLNNIASRGNCFCWKSHRLISLVYKRSQTNVLWDYFSKQQTSVEKQATNISGRMRKSSPRAVSNPRRFSEANELTCEVPQVTTFSFIEVHKGSQENIFSNQYGFSTKRQIFACVDGKHHNDGKTSWIESRIFSLTNYRFRPKQKYSSSCKW